MTLKEGAKRIHLEGPLAYKAVNVIIERWNERGSPNQNG